MAGTLNVYTETERTVIRAFRETDVSDLQEILGDAETMKNCEPPYDLAKTERFLRSFCMERHGAAAAVQKASGKLIGYLLFNEFTEGEYEIGWFFHKAYWRQGYAYESCKALISYAFRQRNARRVFAETVDRVKSVGLMRKLGMRFVGVERRGTENSGQTDLYSYEILREDWERSVS